MTNFYCDRSLIVFFTAGIIFMIGNGVDGKPQSRISGGTLAKPGEFKYMVELKMKGHHLCGGAIISARHILTAAHCVENGIKPTVVTGIIDINDSKGQIYEVSEIIIHPDYVPWLPTRYVECDIAVLVLEKALTLDKHLERVNLPVSQVGPGKTGVVAGWGLVSSDDEVSPFLYKLTVDFLNRRDCRARGIFITPAELCGYNIRGDICGGDSGSPLVSDRSIVGIASASSCKNGSPHIYANVYHHRDWIQKVSGVK